MKRLLIVILVAAGLWAGYWFVGAQSAKSAFANWFDARRTEGWAAEYADLSVKGFPNRFDTTLTDLSLADPRTGWAWDTEFLQLLTLSYKPNHVIVVWPHSQLIATPDQKYDLLSDKMQASIVLAEGTDLALDRITLVADQLRLVPHQGEATEMSALHFALRRLGEAGTQYQLAIAAEDLAPSNAFRALIGENGTLPKTLSSLQADVTLGFDAPWDRFALEQKRPQPTSLKLTLLDATWGDLHLAAAGELSINPEGLASGQITLKARNWREILQLAVSAGALTEGLAQQLEKGLSMLAGMSGNAQTLDLPLDLKNGWIFLGPFPFGKAPVFQLR